MLPKCMLLRPWKGKCFSLFLDNYFIYHCSNYSLFCFDNIYEIPKVLHRRSFKWREDYFQKVDYSGLWYSKIFNNIRIAWLVQYYYFSCLSKLLFSVSMALNLWKFEMISNPSKYLLSVAGFYQRSVLLILYGFQFNWYLKRIPIKNTVFWCISTRGVWSM